MDARTIVEKISLELLLAGKLRQPELQPLIDALRNASLDGASVELLEQFAKQLKESANPADAEHAYKLALSLIESLSGHLASSHERGDQPALASVLRKPDTLYYDASHGPEVLNSFLSEVNGHLQTVEKQLMRLELHARDKDALNAVFGAMHSLKGIAGFLDVKPAHELAHEAETVMELARKREAGIEPAECDAILKAVDALRAIEDCILAHTRDARQPLPAIPAICSTSLSELRRIAQARTAVPAAPTEPAATGGADDAGRSTRMTDRSDLVRVKVHKLDDLIELIGELVVTQTQIHQDAGLRSLNNARLGGNLSQLGKITRELQSIAMSLRMYPLRDVFGRMARLARDLARKEGKELEVLIEGEDTELDKNVIEALVDPLSHLVRNAVDHGIGLPSERLALGKPARGTLTISARHQSGNVRISVADDGRGLDTARIAARAHERGLLGADENPTTARIYSLIFEPGFSTAERVTEISGRGVGLDVVRRNVQALSGRVSVESTPGQSSAFVLTLPLTLAIIDGLIVRTGSERFIVPITSVVECVKPRAEDISTVQERGEVVNVRGTILPLVRLSEFAAVTPDFPELSNAIVMIIESVGERYGLVVDELLGQQQIVIRNLGERMEHIRGIASGAILGDGRVGLILDLEQLLRDARERQDSVLVG